MQEVKFATTEAELRNIIALRYEILRKPWSQPAATASDELEWESSNAYLSDEDGNVLACGRLQKNTEELGQIRFMAVADAYQGKGYGKKILEALENKARLQQLRVLELQARENALEFYLRCGYQKIEATFKLWDLIQHYRMRRHITSEVRVKK